MSRQFAVLLTLAASSIAQTTTSYTSSSYVASSITYSASSADASSTANATSSREPVTHTIAAGKGGHTFSPDVVLAEVGDTIEWQFYPTNHTVIRADYGYPCVPYEMVLGADVEGFWSGWEPVDAVLSDPPSFSVTVNDTDPIFYYCGAPGSCIDYQMVGVINPNASTSLAHQKQLASESTFVLVPGQQWPSEQSIPSGVSTSSTASATHSATSTPTATAAPVSSHSTGISVGAIAGIAIGGAAVLLLAGVAVWFCGRQSNRSRNAMPGAPAQETNVGYHPQPNHASMYGKPAHMSMISGYGMPPNYEQGMRSPGTSATPVDPLMGQHQQLMHPMASSPHMAPVSPSHAHANLYAVGVHHTAPIEMSGEPTPAGGISRVSTEKHGVERYS